MASDLDNEAQRLASLYSYDILDTPPEAEFDDIAQMAAQACGTAMAHINFIDANRQWIKAAVGKQVKLIPVADVVYFQSDTKYTRVVLAAGEALIRTPLKELLAELDPERFWQVHRGTIVNLRAIAKVERDWRDQPLLTLKDRPEKLTVSRTFAHLFKAM